MTPPDYDDLRPLWTARCYCVDQVICHDPNVAAGSGGAGTADCQNWLRNELAIGGSAYERVGGDEIPCAILAANSGRQAACQRVIAMAYIRDAIVQDRFKVGARRLLILRLPAGPARFNPDVIAAFLTVLTERVHATPESRYHEMVMAFKVAHHVLWGNVLDPAGTRWAAEAMAGLHYWPRMKEIFENGNFGGPVVDFMACKPFPDGIRSCTVRVGDKSFTKGFFPMSMFPDNPTLLQAMDSFVTFAYRAHTAASAWLQFCTPDPSQLPSAENRVDHTCRVPIADVGEARFFALVRYNAPLPNPHAPPAPEDEEPELPYISHTARPFTADEGVIYQRVLAEARARGVHGGTWNANIWDGRILIFRKPLVMTWQLGGTDAG